MTSTANNSASASLKLGFTLNGKAVSCTIEPHTLLVQLIRDQLGLTGTHVGCDTSQCGCCTVHRNGQTVKSCTLLAAQIEGQEITTIEGLSPKQLLSESTDWSLLHPVQRAFTECHALQCGFCTPGMIMTVTALLQDNPHPDEGTILHALEGNLCRCTGYVNIVKAVQRAAELMAQRA